MSDNVWRLFEELQGKIAGELRTLLGEAPYDQSLFNEAQKQRRVDSMKRDAADTRGHAERHEAWCLAHLEDGWMYGPEFDPTKKLHPNLVAWDKLPTTMQAKVRVFTLCSQYAAAADEMFNHIATRPTLPDTSNPRGYKLPENLREDRSVQGWEKQSISADEVGNAENVGGIVDDEPMRADAWDYRSEHKPASSRARSKK